MEMKEGKQPEKQPTTSGERFSGFAIGHLTLSALLVFFGAFFLAAPVAEFWPFAPLLLMVIYFPAGVFVAWLEEWTPPQTKKEKYKTVMQPALVAWGWVLVVFFSIWIEAEELLLAVFFISMIFAMPSSVFSLVVFATNGEWSALLLGGILSGLLPPLLFALGSFWQGKRQAEKWGFLVPYKDEAELMTREEEDKNG